MAKFSRSSTAYKQDGSMVAAGVPRFETNGVMVEEGTVNLVANPNFANWTGELPANWAKDGATLTVEKVQGIYAGTNAIKAVNTTSGYLNASKATVSANTTYTVSAITKGGAGAVRFGILVEYYTSGNVFISNSYIAITQLISTDWSKKQFQITTPATAAGVVIKFWIHTTVANNPAYIDYVQLEAKPYATSFHPTTRTAESLTIPATALNASEGTIEFDCVLNDFLRTGLANNPHTLFQYVPTINQWRGIRIEVTVDGKWQLVSFADDGTYTSGLSTITQNNGKHRFGLSYNTNIMSLFIDGYKVITFSNPKIATAFTSILLGKRADGYYANALFSNLRISSIARSDTELSYTGALSVDEYTTYFCSFNGNLSATCHPVMLVQGSGQVLLSRVGRGTRAIKVQGSGQVRLKRSACYYPTIAVGTKGEVKLSRQGIGYRSMKVEGQGSFKIQEPNIEIYPEIREREATTNIIERESTTEVIGVPYAGDTIKIKGSFKTFEGVLADPASITLKIYDTINNLLTTINVTATNKISAGVYEVNYTIPDGYQALYYEWHCVQGDSPQVTMGKITVLKRGQA